MKRILFASIAALLLLLAGQAAWCDPLKDDTYAKLYLEAGDLPPGMKRTQDSRTKGADEGDTEFKKLGGERSGLAVWMGASDQPVWRLVDIRWVFPDAEAAAVYHKARLRQNAENQPRVPGAAPVGQDGYVFGGSISMMGMDIVNYLYLFRVDRVLIKLYVAQDPQMKGTQLRPELVKPIAERAAAQVAAALRAQ